MWQMGAGLANQRHCTVVSIKASYLKILVTKTDNQNNYSFSDKIVSKPRACKLTINNDSCCGAPSFGHYVLSHTCVVGRVRQTRLFDDQIVVDGDVEVSVLCWVNYLFILQPLHLGDRERRN